jgi:phage terminase large subunit GpA-like protein
VSDTYRAALLEAARRELHRRQRAQQQQQVATLNPREWAETYRRIDDKPFTLERHRPLRQIYEDDHPWIVIMKPAQVGCSELAVTRTLHALDCGARWWGTDKAGINVGYLFPTQTALRDFAKERFNGLLAESGHIAAMFTGYNEVGFKQAGDSYLYIRGTFGGGASLLSFPADVLILDEFDRMNPMSVAMAEKRLRASVVNRKLFLSTPTLPGQGIHGVYLQSDQHVWEVPCPHCGGWGEMDFFRDVVADGSHYDEWQHWEREKLRRATFAVHCHLCNHPLDRCAEGRWVAQNPDQEGIRGYHVPSLAFPMVRLSELALHATSDDPNEVEEFYRSDLGIPFERNGATITEAMLLQLAASLPGGALPSGPWSSVTMGVDVGARFHYRISATGPERARYVLTMGACRTWEELSELMERYRVRRCVIDAQPELHATQAWAAKHKGRVLRAFYPSTLKGDLYREKAPETDASGREVGGSAVVQINRTMAMDLVYAVIAGGTEERWPLSVINSPEVLSHLQAPVRVTTTDAYGQPTAVWTHTSPDHLYHATVYDVIAQRTLPKGAGTLGGVLAQGSARGWTPR